MDIYEKMAIGPKGLAAKLEEATSHLTDDSKIIFIEFGVGTIAKEHGDKAIEYRGFSFGTPKDKVEFLAREQNKIIQRMLKEGISPEQVKIIMLKADLEAMRQNKEVKHTEQTFHYEKGDEDEPKDTV